MAPRKKGRPTKNARAVDSDSEMDVDSPTVTPTKPRRGSRVKRRTPAAAANDEAATEELPSVNASLKALTSMMASVAARLDHLEGGQPPRGRVRFADSQREEGDYLEPAAPIPGTSSSVQPPPPPRDHVDPTDVFRPATLQPHSVPGDLEPNFVDVNSMATVSDVVRTRVAQRLRATAPVLYTSDEELDSEAEDGFRRRKRAPKSGKVRTVDSHVIHTVKWPHEMISTLGGATLSYQDLSLAGFVDGFIGIMCTERDRQVKCSAFSTSSKKCNLCLREKYFIICKPDIASLNHRNELASECRHKKRHLLTGVT